MDFLVDVGLHVLGCSFQAFCQAALTAAKSCSSMPIRASACYSYTNNPTFEFLLSVVLVVEAVTSAVLSRAYRSAICSMLAIHVI